MANVFIKDSTMTAIGDAIRAKTGGTAKILPADMATEIAAIETGSDIQLIEGMEIALDFSAGDQSLAAPDGQAVKSATIKKPTTLVPQNIANGVNIAGVVGTLESGGGDGSGITFNPVFAENDWKTIAAACTLNQVPETWAVGDQKTMTINGADYIIDIIGKNHDTYTAGGNIAPLTFQLHDLFGTYYEINSTDTTVGGFDSMDMYNTHLPAIKATMPADVQAAIKAVEKVTNAGGGSYTNETISCDLFLLSITEISANYSYAEEGSLYEYYSGLTNYAKNRTSGSAAGSPFSWFLRSPQRGSSDTIMCVSNDGSTIGGGGVSGGRGVSFAFCF